MSIDIRQMGDSEAGTWNDYVSQSPHATPFHRFEALEVIARHTGTELVRLVGYKGEEPTGVFPVFVLDVRGLPLAFCPPPNTGIHYLGPALLNTDGLKKRTQVSRNKRFIEAVLTHLDDDVDPYFSHFHTAPGYEDVRPFMWEGFSVILSHTFEVDLRPEPDALLQSFSKDARRSIKSGDQEGAVEIHEGGIDALRRVIDRTERVYREQGLRYPLSKSFVVDLFRRLPAGVVRPYVCTVDGEFAGGTVTVETERTVYAWQAGADVDRPVPLYELMDWHVMLDARARGIQWYDLMGADKPSLSRYKAKFDPQLRPRYEVSTGHPMFKIASKGYQMVHEYPAFARVAQLLGG
ncbi:MAG: lipid II:glycine glycyltransferase FemX [Halobacteriota archaeon]